MEIETDGKKRMRNGLTVTDSLLRRLRLAILMNCLMKDREKNLMISLNGEIRKRLYEKKESGTKTDGKRDRQ